MKIAARLIPLLLTLACGAGITQEAKLQLPPGPVAQSGKHVVFIAADYKNGGVMGAYRGFEEAAKKIGWRIQLKDGGGSKAVLAKQLAFALGTRPDGIVIGGFDPGDFAGEMAQAKKARITLVGWHAAKEPGPTDDLFVNISTRPLEVAQMAADFVIQDAKRKSKAVGVIIFNDRQFAVANAKTAAMKQSIEACRDYQGCKVLAVEDVAISEVAANIPRVVSRLVATHGTSWTYSLAINDAYFDEINYPLIASQRTDIVNVSAGDGSNKALGRIAAGIAQQAATVAEPLRLQGFQLADELNRAFAGYPPSGFEAKPILVTTERLKTADRGGIEAKLGFEAAYSAIWGRK